MVLGVALFLVMATEASFQIGRRSRWRSDDVVRSHVATAQASILGLLALLMAFTLSMADSRHDARRRLVVIEANAVGTTYLRTKYLPEPVATQSRELLRRYVTSRRAYFRASAGEAPIESARSVAISNDLWERGAALAAVHLVSDLIALYLTSLNEMIDAASARRAAVIARIPTSIRALVLFIGVLAMFVTGYSTGLAGRRIPILLTTLPIAIALTYSIITDLDRARSGLVSTGDFPMIQVERALDADVAASAPTLRTLLVPRSLGL
jgi:hypothetical protein